MPQTLQRLTLALPLDQGIPRILERSLRILTLDHSEDTRMHLDRPLDPFLDLPRLEKLALHSWWGSEMTIGMGMCMWTPPALRYLGLAENCIMQMQATPPGRSITLDY